MSNTISFYNECSNESLEILLLNHRLYGNIDGEDLTPNELISVISSLSEHDTVKLIKAFGPKRFKHAYRKLLWESPVKILDRELKESNSSLEEYLELSYRAGLNPLPALRARGIKVKFGGQNAVSPHFMNEDIIVFLKAGFVTVLFNPWDRYTEKNIVNKDLQFQLTRYIILKENRKFRLKNRIIRKKIIKYSSED